MSKVRIFFVAGIQLDILKSNPPQLSISVTGVTTTGGWSNPELVPIEKTVSADGILDLEFVASPPPSGSSVPQVLTPTAASFVWKDDVDRIVGVRIVSRTNDPVQLVGSNSGGTVTTFAIGEESPALTFGDRGDLTTLAIGEETVPFGEKSPFGETSPVGEKGPLSETGPFGETFDAFGRRNPFGTR